MNKKSTTLLLALAILLCAAMPFSSAKAQMFGGNIFTSVAGELPDDLRIGTDLTTVKLSEISPATKIEPGKAVKYSFTAYTPETQNWLSPLFLLTKADQTKYGIFRLDNWADEPNGFKVEELGRYSNWYWNEFLTDINGSNIEAYLYNKGDNTADVYIHIKCSDDSLKHQFYCGIPVDKDDLYASVSSDNSYMIMKDISNEDLSAPEIINGTLPEGNQLGTDVTTPFNTIFTPQTVVEKGKAVQYKFTVKSNGVANHCSSLYYIEDTYSTATDKVTVLRNDNYGWGLGYSDNIRKESNWNWDKLKEELNDAEVTVTIYNPGNNTAEVHIKHIGGSTNFEYFQSYRGIPITGETFKISLSCESSYIIFDNFETGESTAITDIDNSSDVISTEYFNLQGQKVDANSKGVLIKVDYLSNGTRNISKCVK